MKAKDLLEQQKEDLEDDVYNKRLHNLFENIYSKDFQHIFMFLVTEDKVEKSQVNNLIDSFQKLLKHKRIGECTIALTYTLLDVLSSDPVAFSVIKQNLKDTKISRTTNEDPSFM